MVAAGKTVRAGLIALAVSAGLGAAGVGPESWVRRASAAMFVPDPVFAGTLTAAQQTEMMAWGQAYFNRIEGVNQGGSNAVATPWNFATPVMNSPLFNPFYGPRQTLVNLGQVSEADCFKALVETPGTDAASATKRSAIKDALIGFTIKTDPVTDPNGTTAHIVSILDAAYVAGLVTYTQDGKLVSEKLPLAVLEGAGVSAQFADNLSESSVTALLVLTSQAPGIVASATGVTEAQAMVGGQGTKANSVATAIAALLNQAGVAGASVERMDAIFSVYGLLPTVYVALSDCAVLIDATTGVVTSPIKLGTPLDASGLLAQHANAAVSPFAHRMMSAAGCTYVVSPFWQTTPDPSKSWVPRPAAPGTVPPLIPIPTLPLPLPRNPNYPGWPTNWSCVTLGGGTASAYCECTDYQQYVDIPLPSTQILWSRVICTSPANVGGCTGMSPPAAPPTTPGAPPTPGGGWGCVRYYFW